MTAGTGSTRDAALGRLGLGGRDDRLRFRLVLRLLLRCLGLLRPVRGHLALLFGGFALLAALFFPIGLLLMDVFWSRILEGAPLTGLQARLLLLDPAVVASGDALGAAARRAVLDRALAVGVALALLAIPAGLGLLYYRIWILQRVNQLLRLQLLDRLQSLSLRFHAESRVGDAIYRMYQDSAMVTQLVEVLFLVPVEVAGRYLFCLGAVALFDPLLAFVLLALWLPFLALGAWVSRRLRVRFRRARETSSDVTSRIQETLAGIRVIKAYGAEGAWQGRFERASRRAFDAAFAARGLLGAFLVTLFWGVGAALVAGSALAAVHTLRGDALFDRSLLLPALGFQAWTLGVFNYFKLRFGDGAAQLRNLFRTWGRTQDVAIGLDRVFEVLDLEPEVREAADARRPEGVREGIRFRDVSFSYAPGEPTLEGIDLEARVGTITAVVGPTGSGKTTLMALLLRLFDADRGAIELDGVDLRALELAWLRRHVAVALQENWLFGTSVRENIRYALPGASDAAVREAARVAGADAFIEKLPEGYDTLLGERGTKLSTGQRQRLSIARAVLKDAPILILDEPTASLDAETELRVLRRLREWGRGRLVFLITHRLSTIRRADQIAVLRDGRLVEVGSHEALLRREGGAYRALVATEEAGGSAPAAAAGGGA